MTIRREKQMQIQGPNQNNKLRNISKNCQIIQGPTK